MVGGVRMKYHVCKRGSRQVRDLNKAKFLVIGGYVVSPNDGEIHFVPAHELCRLYGLDPRVPNVRLADIRRPETLLGYDDSWIVLTPRSSGDYTLR